jgi:alkylhydroperoxidase family enzyme
MKFDHAIFDDSRLPLVNPEDVSNQVQEALKKLPLINIFRSMANAEKLYPSFIEYLDLLFGQLATPRATVRIVILRVTERSDCYYAFRQNAIVAKNFGVTDVQLSALETGDKDANCFDAGQRAILNFTDELMERIEVSDETFAETKKHFSDEAIAEFILIIGTYMTVARFVRTAHVPLDDEPANFNPEK